MQCDNSDRQCISGRAWLGSNELYSWRPKLELEFSILFFYVSQNVLFFFPTIEKVKTHTHTHILGSKAIQKQVVGLFGQISVIVCQLSLK